MDHRPWEPDAESRKPSTMAPFEKAQHPKPFKQRKSFGNPLLSHVKSSHGTLFSFSRASYLFFLLINSDAKAGGIGNQDQISNQSAGKVTMKLSVNHERNNLFGLCVTFGYPYPHCS